MLSVTEAREKLMRMLKPVGVEEIRLSEAIGRVLAEPLAASVDSPVFTNSSMDGFAVKGEDIEGACADSPVVLKVVGDIPAGIAPDLFLKEGEAARIMTGAVLPEGADTVVPVELTSFNYRDVDVPLPEAVEIQKAVEEGGNVRVQGEDFSEGEELLPVGGRLRPQEIGILAMMGRAMFQVYRKPRVAVISTGDELLPVESPLEPGKIRETNSYTLAALIANCGGEVVDIDIVPDNNEAIRKALDSAAEADVDVIITSAGVSVGAYDLVRPVIEENGRLEFWRVNMRPGKPLAFGEYLGVPFVGLPGNPVSSFVGFEVFLRPALHCLGGVEGWERQRMQARLEQGIESDGRESYLRVNLAMEGDGLTARLTGHQGSGNLYSLVRANGLIIVPAGVKSMEPGAMVEAWLLA